MFFLTALINKVTFHYFFQIVDSEHVEFKDMKYTIQWTNSDQCNWGLWSDCSILYESFIVCFNVKQSSFKMKAANIN